MFEKELTVRFSWGDPTTLHGRLLELVGSGALDPTPAITHRLPLDDAAEAYRLFDAPRGDEGRAHGVRVLRAPFMMSLVDRA